MDPDGFSLDFEGWISITHSENWCTKEDRINPYIYIYILKNNFWWQGGNTNVCLQSEPLSHFCSKNNAQV